MHGPQDLPMALQAPTPLPRCIAGKMAWNRMAAELPLDLLGLLFFFFAEHVVLNLSMLKMQFSQQINSLLKILSATK